jgi:hypothetical protein
LYFFPEIILNEIIINKGIGMGDTKQQQQPQHSQELGGGLMVGGSSKSESEAGACGF